MKRYLVMLACCIMCLSLISADGGCDSKEARSASGVAKATVKVNTDSNGHTVEQANYMERIKRDNEVGSIKHLYVISPFSGQVIIYSTVKGKVTSSGKRLSPSKVRGATDVAPFKIDVDGTTLYTDELLSDDGMYGSSVDYIYWFDQRGVYHQHYLRSEIVHISDQPLSIKGVIINMELQGAKDHPVLEK